MFISIRKTFFFSSTLFILSACGSASHTYGFTYHGIYFGKHLSADYTYGIRDGCETARGIYTKSHRLFHINNDYYNGWFLGRNKCRGLLKIDENDNLIL